ncbi:DUF499 domain-containing protein [Thermosphaera aggregans]|uniref:ATPase (AAA+ superfamily) n=1 Tax=Thermosphaera aggregans (strain DSM 11486 / M11TL) TaxID=633148 RepID=D5U1P2_THEAM|nr:DUF499 domain-containing protein [Thermosphaera aggregans]ADG91042.1 ATPase (AAA+ superfamily) [Thermosphaera aggregans DSM 11486]
MTSQSVKPFTSVLKPRPEVLEGRVVEALSLANIYLFNELREKIPEVATLEPSPLYYPEEFLRRTYFSEAMKRVVLKVFGGLAGATYLYLDDKGNRLPVSSKVIIIPSHLGGGKTHLLATLYHLSKLVNEKGESVVRYFEGDRETSNALKHAVRVIAEQGGIRVVAIVGDTRTLAPSPDKPLEIDGLRIHTPWGLLAYLLGAYAELENADQHHLAPKVDELRRLLKGKSVLILLDEAVEYMETAVRLDSTYKGYSDSFQSFIRNLAEAVSDTPGSVLVVTLPAEYREGVVTAGLQHPEYVEKVRSMLERVAHEYIPPLEVKRDIVEVFKRRLFENALSKEVSETAYSTAVEAESKARRDSTLESAAKARYGDLTAFREKVRESYPFHPGFIEALVQVASSNPQLGLTRYMLAYVARLIRHLYELKSRRGRDAPVALITPWLIPFDKIEFRTELLRGLHAQYQNDFLRIYEQEVKHHDARLENALWTATTPTRQALYEFLKGAVSRTIWLYTIPGRGSKNASSLKLYPSVHEIPVLVYDPLFLSETPMADVLNVVNDLLNTSTYLYRMDGRVFYALVPDILKFLRERYVSTTDFDALISLEKLVNKQSFKPGRKIERVYPILTDKEGEIEKLVKEALASTRSPVLFVYLALSPPPDSLERVVLVRNNIVLLIAEYGESPVDRGLVYTENVKRIVGSEPATLRDYLKSLLRLSKVLDNVLSSSDFLREEFGDEFHGLIQENLRKMRADVERQITAALFSSFRRVVLGTRRTSYTVDLKPVDEEVKDLSTLAKLLEEFLEKRGVATSWTWLGIYNQLSGWGEIWDSDRSLKKPVKLGDLWEQLLGSSSVKPHLTRYVDFEEAVREAYDGNLIALRHGEKILWLKHPYRPEEAEQYYRVRYQKAGRLNDWDRDVKQELERLGIRLSDLEAVSPRMIVREYVDMVRKQAQVRPGEKVVRRLVVYLPDGKQDLPAFMVKYRSDVELAEALSKYPIVLEEETPPRTFDLRVLRINDRVYSEREGLVEIEGEGSVKLLVEGRVEADEVFPVSITLKAVDEENREVSSRRFETKTPAVFTLELEIKKAGVFNVFVTASEPGGYRIDETPVARVRVRGELCVEKTYPATEAERMLLRGDVKTEVKTMVLNGMIRKGAISNLSEALADLGLNRVRVTGNISFRSGGEEIIAEFKNADAAKIAKIVGSIGVEDLEVDMEFQGVGANTLFQARTAKALLLDPSSPLSPLVKIVVRECSRI